MVNKVILVGNVGKDPEIKHLDSGKTVANFTLATSEKYKEENKTTWHNIVIWGKLAEIVEKYVKKGDKLFLSGKIDIRWYEKDARTIYVTEIVCNEMTMLGGSSSNNVKQETKADEKEDLPF